MSSTDPVANIEARCPPPGEDGVHFTFCRLCEAVCGLAVTVKGGKAIAIAPDRLNPHSQGHVCVKGMNFHETANDPDRVLTPLKRVGGPGEFAPVSWDEALDDIAGRLRAILDERGPEAVAFYIGNPSSFATDLAISHGGFMKALGARKGYSPGSQDSNARSVANFAVFGNAMLNAFPDLKDCDLLLIIGANPLVSNGSILFAPRIRHDLDAIAARGRVIVIDPRATETARRYEHVPVRPNTDIWLLLGMLRTLFEEELVDRDAIAEHAHELDRLEAEIACVDVAQAASLCGMAEAALRDLARAFAATPRAAAYSRVGLCRGPFATLANCMITALNVVAGKFGRHGGMIFGHTLLAGSERSSVGGYGGGTSRIGNIPLVHKYSASAVMPDDILVEGEGQVRALFQTAGNPVLSAPGGARLEEALQSLDLFVAFDFYVNESARFADYVLPSTTFLERADFPYVCFNILMRPFVHYTEAVVEPIGEARHEHDVYREIVRRAGLVWPSRTPEERAAEERGEIETPVEKMDKALRMGFAGDHHGARDGWSIERLRGYRHGVMVDLPDPTEHWWTRLGYADHKLRLFHEIVEAEFARFWREWRPPPRLSLIGRRDIRSINSWMHNVDKLVRSQEAALLVHPDDAAEFGLADGGHARIWNRHGALEVEVAVTDEVAPGTLCYPHGWGHRGGWKRANATPGRNINVLLGLGVESVEFVSGTTLMDGIAVSIAPIPDTEKLAAPTAAE